MIYREEQRDLFTVPCDYWLAHCISSDFALGGGIALAFVKRFNMRKMLFENFPVLDWHNTGYVRVVPGIPVFNLITKQHVYQKPTYKNLVEAVEAMRDYAVTHNIRKIAMPLIGCGIDGLNWIKVSAHVQRIFKDIDIEILVCIRQEVWHE